MRIVVLWLLLLTGMGWAYGPAVEFTCEPSDTRIYLDSGELLGMANTPIKLRRDQLGPEVKLVFQREGWHEARLTVPRDALQGDHYPPYGTMTLTPDSSLTGRAYQAGYALRANLAWLCVPFVLSLMMGLGKRALDERTRGIGASSRKA